MPSVAKLSSSLSKHIGILILLCSAWAFWQPSTFAWATSYTAWLLGIAMFGMGLTISAQDFAIIAQRPKAILLGCLAQYSIMPLAAWCLAKGLGLPPDLALGVILVGCCPGGTASNVITSIAGGDVALSVGMTTVSTLLAPLLTPLLVYLLGGAWVEVSFVAMVISVLNIVLLPVLMGVGIHTLLKAQVAKVTPALPLLSVVAIVLLISGIVATNVDKIMVSGLLIFCVVIAHNGIGLLCGLLLARLFGLSYKQETAVAIEVAMQNSGLALSLASVNFALNPLATLPGALFSIWHNISGSIFASLRRRSQEKPADSFVREVQNSRRIKVS